MKFDQCCPAVNVVFLFSLKPEAAKGGDPVEEQCVTGDGIDTFTEAAVLGVMRLQRCPPSTRRRNENSLFLED